MRGLLVKNKFIFNFFKKGALYFRFLKSILVGTKLKIYDQVEIDEIIDINDKEHHCFFGYYDKRIFSKNDDFIIFHKVSSKKKFFTKIKSFSYDSNDLTLNFKKKITQIKNYFTQS